MSEYKNIIGKGVRFLSSNLDNDQAEGQIWYNSTDGAFKNVIVSTAWHSGSPLVSPFGAQVAYGGTQTAAFYAGGTPGTVTLEYNGSGWSSGGAINTARYRLAGAGTLTAGLAFGGQNPGNTAMQTATEEYDGSSWTSNPTGLSTGRAPVGSAGTQTAGLAFGGRTGLSPPFGDTNATEEYNGSGWTSGGNLPSTILQHAGTGIQTAALSFGGAFPPSSATAATNEYNGTAWTAGGNLNTARASLGSAGIQTSALAFGGSSTSATEDYDGSSWTTNPATLGTLTEIGGTGPIGSSEASLTAGNPGASTATEEYDKSINVTTAAAWASGGNLGTGRYSGGGFGIQTAAVFAGGKYGSPPTLVGVALSEEYNGTSWSEGNDLNTARRYLSGAAGTETSGVVFGGFDTSPGATAATEEYDGTSWTNGGNLNSARGNLAGSGTQTAALGAGGTGRVAVSEEYNGTSWSEGNDLNTARASAASSSNGLQTASLCFGGSDGPGSQTDATESYDGTSWTNVNSMLLSRESSGGSGTQTAALVFGGYDGSANTSNSESWDGTSWVTAPSLGRSSSSSGAGAGLQTAAIQIGDAVSPNAATEEFTGETSALNVKTITTS